MNSTLVVNSIPLEMDYAEHRRVVKVPRESAQKKMMAKVVRLAQQFHSDILFNAGSFHINGKSPLIAYTLLNALKGQTMEIIARGRDSVQAVKELARPFARRRDLQHREEREWGARP